MTEKDERGRDGLLVDELGTGMGLTTITSAGCCRWFGWKGWAGGVAVAVGEEEAQRNVGGSHLTCLWAD